MSRKYYNLKPDKDFTTKYDIRKHLSGVLITSQSAFTLKKSIKEAVFFLKYHRPNLSSETEPNPKESLDEEIEDLKREDCIFKSISNIAKGINFITSPYTPAEMNDLVYNMLTALKNQNHDDGQHTKLTCRFLNRIVPLDICCSPHMKTILNVAAKLVAAYFPNSNIAEKFKEIQGENLSNSEESNTTSYTINNGFSAPINSSWALKYVKRSGIKTVDKEELTKTIGEYVGQNYTVNLSKPEYTILIELNPVFCGLSVLRAYNELCHYNIQTLCQVQN